MASRSLRHFVKRAEANALLSHTFGWIHRRLQKRTEKFYLLSIITRPLSSDLYLGFLCFPPSFSPLFFLSYSKSQSLYLFKFQYSIFQLKSTRRVYTAHQVSHSHSPFFFQTNHFTLLFFFSFGRL